MIKSIPLPIAAIEDCTNVFDYSHSLKLLHDIAVSEVQGSKKLRHIALHHIVLSNSTWPLALMGFLHIQVDRVLGKFRIGLFLKLQGSFFGLKNDYTNSGLI